MRSAETVLLIIRARGMRGLPLEDVYRQLFNPELYLHAYGRIARNAGALTPGATAETADGMSLQKIQAIIELVRHERYRWTPVRRLYIEKRNSTKKRPLGIPTWSDKLLQEVLRSILEAYYEPQFSPRSHGFRPGLGCHTALRGIQRTWIGTAWFVEGDVTACFDSLDHQVLLAILRERIHDNRFLRLLENLLKAGYLEDWTYNRTLSGSPQGGIVSPILANIYLDRLDQFVETTLLPTYNRGLHRKNHPEWQRLQSRAYVLAKRGQRAEALALRRQFQRIPSHDPTDPDYRRLRYVRYADDFLLGFCGPRHEAELIKEQLGEFLREQLKLELSETKTLITHARSEAARFLGYELVVLHNDQKHDQRGHRSVNGRVGLKVPLDVVRAKCVPYLHGGKPISRRERLHDAPFSIVAQYQQEFRGLAEYYQLAYNLHRLSRLEWVMRQSLTHTLAHKLRLRVQAVCDRYQTTIQTDRGARKVLQITVERGQWKAPLVAQWGGISLARRKDAILDDRPPRVWNTRSELLERLLADTCELCDSPIDIEVHHIRHLRDLQRPGRAPRPLWVETMAARHRKTLVVCAGCHRAIHQGRPPARPRAAWRTGEPDLSKG